MSVDSISTPLTALPLTAAAAGKAAQETTKDSKDVDAIAKDFEAVFLSQMLSNMFAGDEANSFFGKGSTGDIYKSFLMNEYGKSISNAGGIGIADTVKQELLKMQEVAT